jgi:2-amino-4-hydroxy-6-hydroxymethyldihydropteridine diphosphokinase
MAIFPSFVMNIFSLYRKLLLKKHIAYISIGSNIGDKLQNCRKGVEDLGAVGKTKLIKLSRFYRTSPVDNEDQDWFVNAAVEVATSLGPQALLHEIKRIQASAGRKTEPIRFGPRILDLDIIFYDRAVLKSPELEIPHPRMHKRRFVLQPMCDIDPFIIHPVIKKDVRTLLEEIEDPDQKIEEL